MKESKPSPPTRQRVRVRAVHPLRYAPHTAPFERDQPVASAAREENAEHVRKAQTHEERDDLFGGMV